MKKILSLGLLLSSTLFASHEEGIRYGIGGRAGIAAFTGKVCSMVQENRDTAAIPITKILEITEVIKPGTISFQAGIFAEIAYRSCDWSFGTLADINGDTLNSTVKNRRYSPNLTLNTDLIEQKCIKSPLHIGIDIRAGKYFNDALWYGLIGIEGIRMEYNNYLADSIRLLTQNGSPIYITFGTPCGYKNCWTACSYNSKSFWKAALRVGSGIEYNWTDCLNLKLEYRFVWAGKKQFNYASPVVAGFVGAAAVNAQAFGKDTVYMSQNVVALMASYQF